MKRQFTIMKFATVWFALATSAIAAEPANRIAWFGRLTDGLAEAKRSHRPILLVSAAPQCVGVPGMW